MGRPPKKARDRKSRYLSFPVEKVRLQAYKNAAAKGFKGNVATFLRAAADALAEQLGHPVAPPVKPPSDPPPKH